MILTGSAAFAQLAKSTFLLGGTTSYLSGSYTTASGLQKHKTSTLLLSPEAGYFILPKLVAGLRLQFSDDRDKTVENNGYGGLPSDRTTSLNIAPFVRYYLLNQNNKLINCFVEGSYGFGKIKIYNPLIENSTHIFYIVAGPEIYFNSTVGIEFTIGYYKSYTTDFNVTTIGLQASIGFQIHLGRDNP
jgi:hypothetical protein